MKDTRINAPLWRKLLSSNWWWYGEVYPDTAKLPSPENRPKLWRMDAIIAIGFMPVLSIFIYLSAELNSRYWPFNENQFYIGYILTVQNSDRQLLVQLSDLVRVEMGWPIMDNVGFQRNKNWRPTLWAPAMKKLIDGHYQCPGRRLRFYGEFWKFTFRPVIRIWRVDCADSSAILVDEQWVREHWRKYMQSKLPVFLWISIGFAAFGLMLAVKREKKLYVKL